MLNGEAVSRRDEGRREVREVDHERGLRQHPIRRRR
jgi:hypothetical protein